jgi:hypothetical protein
MYKVAGEVYILEISLYGHTQSLLMGVSVVADLMSVVENHLIEVWI